MESPQFIKDIKSYVSVVEYLESLGYHPAKQYGNRCKYICPIHGPEKEPSFFVYDDNDFQTFKCYGCGNYGDVINLHSIMEGMPLKRSIRTLAKAAGIEFTSEADIDRVINEIANYKKHKETFSIEDINYHMSRSCHDFLEMVNYDPVEFEFIEEVFKKVDKMTYALDTAALKEAYEFTVDVGLPKRLEQYRKKYQYGK